MGGFDDLIPGGTTSNGFDDLIPSDGAKPKKRSIGDIAGDIGVTALKGAVGLPQAVVGIADIPTGGRVGKALEGIGYRPAETQRVLDTKYSEPQQAANKAVREAEGFVPTLKAAIDNPSTIAATVGESLPQMMGGAGIARGVMRGAEIAGKKLSPVIAGAIGEGAIGAGSAAENMRAQSEDGLLTPKQSMAAAGSGIGTAVFGAAGGKLAQRFGLGDVDTILTQGGPNAVAAGAAKQGFLKQVAGSGLAEGVFEELPQSVQEQMWQNYANDKPLTDGVGNAAAMGMLAGTALGGVAGGYNALARQPEIVPPVPEDQAISGLLTNPASTGTPSHQVVAADVERANAVATAQANADALYKSRAEFEASQQSIPETSPSPGEAFTTDDVSTLQGEQSANQTTLAREIEIRRAMDTKAKAQLGTGALGRAAAAGIDSGAIVAEQIIPTPGVVTGATGPDAASILGADAEVAGVQGDLPTANDGSGPAAVTTQPVTAKGPSAADIAAATRAPLGGKPLSVSGKNSQIDNKPAATPSAPRTAVSLSTAPDNKPTPIARVGTTPNNAEDITVKDGVIYMGKFAAQNFETGEDIRVGENADFAQVKKALQDGGALTSKQRVYPGVFGSKATVNKTPLPESGAPELQPTQQPVEAPNKPPSKLKAMIDALLADKEIRGLLPEFAKLSGWAERGGHVLRDANTGEVTGRTKWIPRADWWEGKPEGVTEKLIRSGVPKALNSQLITKPEREAVEWLLSVIETDIAQMSHESVAIANEIADDIDDISFDALGETDPRKQMEALGFTEDKINETLETGRKAEETTAGTTQESDQHGNETQAAEAGQVDRRQNPRRRKKITDMTHDEMRRELLIDAMTGLGNRRAYQESTKLATQVSIDTDGLKWINDHLGHESGDRLLETIGKVIAEETTNGFHISGDEFVIQTHTKEEADAIMARVVERLNDVTIESTTTSGEVITMRGIGISFGIDGDLKNAEKALREHKSQREREGLRGGRGTIPPNAVIGKQGNQDRQDNDPAEEERPALNIAGQTSAEIAAAEARDRKAAEKSARDDAKPSGPDVTADQVDLFNTQGGLFDRAGELPRGGASVPTDASGANPLAESPPDAGATTTMTPGQSSKSTLPQGTTQVKKNSSTLPEDKPSANQSDGTYADPYQTIGVRPNTTPKQLSVGRAALNDAEKRIFGRNKEGFRLLGSNISADFLRNGGVSLIGQEVNGPEDLAFVAQVLRDPGFETFRTFFTDAAGKIVYERVYSSRLAGAVYLPENHAAQIHVDMRASGATGYWLLHNHPSGSAAESKADLNLTAKIAKETPGFKGHVVIDHNEYNHISVENGIAVPNLVQASKLASVNLNANPEVAHPLLGEKVNGPSALAVIAKLLQTKDGYAVLIGTNAQQKISLLTEVPVAYLKGLRGNKLKGLRAVAAIKRATGETGSTSLFAVVPGDVLDYGVLIDSGILRDVVSMKSGESASKQGLLEWNGVPVSNVARSGGKGYVAQRDEPPQPAQKQTETKAFKKWFGDSKVVDADGKPLVVFHGTGADFAEFDPGKVGSTYGVDKRGFFFTNSPHHAAWAADDAARASGGTENIMPLYLSTKNPLMVEVLMTYHGYAVSYLDEYKASILQRQRAGKHDGIIVRKGDDVVYVVFKPKQIKSAIGNNGKFNPSNPSIVEQPATPYQANEPIWSIPLTSRMDTFLYEVQDKHIDAKRVIESIKTKISDLADEFNTYVKEALYHGRADKRTKDFLTDELTPLVDAMAKAGATQAQLNEYLHARHAIERNRVMRERNPDREDNSDLSGMSDEQANDILKKAPLKMAILAKRVDAIVAKSRQELVEYGLETQETVDAWSKLYKHYVPLKREGFDDTAGTGQGFSVRGSSTKEAVGSRRAVDNIFANIAMQRERNITRGEKNRVALSLYGLVKTNPNSGFWKLDKPAQITQINAETGLPEVVPGDMADYKVPMISYISKDGTVQMRVDPAYKGRDNVVTVRVNGVDHAVIFNESDPRALRMAESLKNLDMDQLGEVIGSVGRVTRYIAAVNTQYNPVFGVTNLLRDVQTAMLNLQSTPLKGKQRDVMKEAVGSLKGIYQDARAVRLGKHPDSEYAKDWEEFQNVGGQTGYRDMFRTAKDRAAAIEHMLDPAWWQKTYAGKLLTLNGVLAKPEQMLFNSVGKHLFRWLEDYNTSMENAMRLAAYRVGKRNGMSREAAAFLAKSLTVNFNKKGRVATQAGALYAFFNASAQGTARIAETLTHGAKPGEMLGKTGKAIVTGGITLGAMQALLLLAAGFDEDEPPEFVRERNLIIPAPGTDKGYITIPMPLGFHVLPNIGRVLVEGSVYGKPLDRMADLMLTLFEAFNPIGTGASLAQTISPTVADPIMALSENKDWTGKRIFREDFSQLDPTPGFTRTKDNASILAKGLAYGINAITGGSDYTPGKFSPTPDQIDYLIGQATGGVGREVTKAATTAGALITGEELPMYKVPLVGRLIGSAGGESGVRDKFYDNLRTLNLHEAEIQGRRDKREPVIDYLAEHPEARLAKYAGRVESKIREKKRLSKQAKEDGRDTRLIDAQIVNMMKQLNERVDGARP